MLDLDIAMDAQRDGRPLGSARPDHRRGRPSEAPGCGQRGVGRVDSARDPTCAERIWSGRRDSNPRPSPWQGDALPTEPLPLGSIAHLIGGAESQDSNWRHRDFQSRALPTELSRPDGQPAVGCPSAGREDTTGPARAAIRTGPSSSRGLRGWAASAAVERLLARQLAEPIDPVDRSPGGSRTGRSLPLLELLDRVREVHVLGGLGLRLRGPPCRPRSWRGPARGRTGSGSAPPRRRRRGTRAGG